MKSSEKKLHTRNIIGEVRYRVSAMDQPITAMSVKMIATITSNTDGKISGELDCAYFSEPYVFSSLVRMIEVMETTFDTKGYPEKHLLPRSFHKAKQRMKKHEIDLYEHIKQVNETVVKVSADGKISSFEILVQFRHNAEWQGQIHWVERDTTKKFESIVEMVKLIDEALKSQ